MKKLLLVVLAFPLLCLAQVNNFNILDHNSASIVGGTISGATINAATQATSDNSTLVATDAFVQNLAVSTNPAPPKTIVFAGDSLTNEINVISSPSAVSATSTIATLGTIVAGSGYVAGTYTGVALTGGTGTGAVATIVVNGDGTVHTGGVTITSAGASYALLDSLTTANTNLGGTGSGFSVPVATIGTSYGTLIKITNNGHSIGPGQEAILSSANQIEFNGCWHVVSVIDFNNFTVNLTYPATVATPTGAISLGQGNWFGNTGYWTYLTGFKLKMLNNAGLSGDTTIAGISSQFPGLYSRLGADVFAYNPQIAVVLIGTNDVGYGTETATQIANNIIMIDNAILARGIKVVVVSLPPMGSAWSGFSAANAKLILDINRQLRQYAEITPGTVYADIYAGLVDPTSSVATELAANTLDGIHPSSQGAYIYAQYIGKALARFNVPNIDLVNTALDTYANDTTSFNTISNPLMIGSGGTAGTNTSGVIPPTWKITTVGGGGQSAVSAVTARTMAADGDISGSNMVVTAVSAANNDSIHILSNVTYTSQFTNGQWLYGDCDVGWSNTTNLKFVEANVQLTVGGNTYNSYWQSVVDSTYFQPSFRGYAKIPPMWVPATGTITGWNLVFYMNFSGVGGGTFQVGRCQLRQAASLSLIN